MMGRITRSTAVKNKSNNSNKKTVITKTAVNKKSQPVKQITQKSKGNINKIEIVSGLLNTDKNINTDIIECSDSLKAVIQPMGVIRNTRSKNVKLSQKPSENTSIINKSHINNPDLNPNNKFNDKAAVQKTRQYKDSSIQKTINTKTIVLKSVKKMERVTRSKAQQTISSPRSTQSILYKSWDKLEKTSKFKNTLNKSKNGKQFTNSNNSLNKEAKNQLTLKVTKNRNKDFAQQKSEKVTREVTTKSQSQKLHTQKVPKNIEKKLISANTLNTDQIRSTRSMKNVLDPTQENSIQHSSFQKKTNPLNKDSKSKNQRLEDNIIQNTSSTQKSKNKEKSVSHEKALNEINQVSPSQDFHSQDKSQNNFVESNAEEIYTKTNKNHKNKTPIYKKILSKNNISKRITRRIDHLYDLDISNEPTKAFKKTRDGFKLKKNTKGIHKKNKTKMKPKRPNFQTEQEKNMPKNITSPAIDSNIHKNLDKTCAVILPHIDEQLMNREVVDVEPMENIDYPESVVEPENDHTSDNGDNCNDFWPLISTPLPGRLLKKHLESINFCSPINKNIQLKNTNSRGSPWRISAVESNRQPVNFPIKNSLLPTYQKDTTLRYSNLDTNATIVALTTKPISPVKLFTDDFMPISKSTLNEFGIQEKNNISEEITITAEGPMNNNENTTSAYNITNEFEIREQNDENEDIIISPQSSLKNSRNSTSKVKTPNKENRQDSLHNFYGFDCDNENVNVLKEINQNIPKTTRVSLTDIKNAFHGTRKRKEVLNDKENIDNNIFKKFKCVNVFKKSNDMHEPEEESGHCEDNSKSEQEQFPNLFEDPEDLELSLNLNKDFRCYDPKDIKKMKKFEVKSPKKKKACKLSTEEWVAARKWERDFNAMVEEVESFEMIIE